MDETLSRVVIDISGRPVLVFKVEFPRDKVGSFDTELVREWFNAFAMNAGVTLHVETLYGENSHHIAESCFKGLARALRAAVAIDPRAAGEVPSTKGQLGSWADPEKWSGSERQDFLFFTAESAMPVYTVHAPAANGADFAAPDKFTFVRDGFHFWACFRRRPDLACLASAVAGVDRLDHSDGRRRLRARQARSQPRAAIFFVICAARVAAWI